jgi:hypothetical protein
VPIRPENVGLYPSDWDDISFGIRDERAKWRCECDGRCGRWPSCVATDGRCPAIGKGPNRSLTATGKPVVLTVAHLDHDPTNCDPGNLKAMCEACHLNYDREHHAATRAATRAAELATQMNPLFDLEES